MKISERLLEERITPEDLKRKGVPGILDKIRRSNGYYVTNTERDLSQSDFKNRIMPHTQLLVAKERNDAGYFSIEITGGASIHVDMLRKQMNPLEKLEILSAIVTGRYFQVEISITDPSVEVHAMVGDFTLKFCQ